MIKERRILYHGVISLTHLVRIAALACIQLATVQTSPRIIVIHKKLKMVIENFRRSMPVVEGPFKATAILRITKIQKERYKNLSVCSLKIKDIRQWR